MIPKPYYERGGIVIYVGDCREVLPALFFDSRHSLLLTDPPYGLSFATNHEVGGKRASWFGTTIAGDDSTELRDWVIEWATDMPMLVFGSWKVQRPAKTRGVLIWDKGPAFGMGDLTFPWKLSWEEIYVLGQGFSGHRDEGVLKGFTGVSWESKGRCHPNEKPVSLLRYLIGKTEARTVIDPFMGSGSTIRAAKDLGLDAIGIEINEAYCKIAARRLSQEVMALEVPA